MLRKILTTILLFAAAAGFSPLSAQIAVADFYLDETDQVANEEGTEKFDQNGYRCAIIKVETTQTGFTFDVGSLGVTDVVQQAGEIWVYVPFGVKHMTIGHPQLGILRNYYFPIPVEKARVYIMKLTTGTVRTEVEQAVTQQYVLFKVEPKDAVVTFDGKILNVVDGTATARVAFGKYDYRVDAGMYHPEVGRLQVSDPENRVVKSVTLLPAFGYVQVAGAGAAQGARVLLDNTPVGTVPFRSERIASGRHNLKVVKPMYKPWEQVVEIADGQTLELSPQLSADFARLTLQTAAEADIYVNGEKKGRGSWTGELGSGQYLLECKQAHHRSTRRELAVTADLSGQTVELEAPAAITGSLDINSTPADADVYIDGRKAGQTPLFLAKHIIGEHDVRITKAGYADYAGRVAVAEKQTATLSATLRNGMAVQLLPTNPVRTLRVDGQAVSDPSQPLTLTIGSHVVDVEGLEGEQAQQQVSVVASESVQRIEIRVPSKAVREFTVKGVKFTMRLVEAGTFQMGGTPEQENPASDEKVHTVTLTRDYYLGATEVTQALWEAVTGENPSGFKGSNRPVEQVSWDDCQRFINALNLATGEQFRLPTEAEWEYAARGGSKSRGTQYSGSAKIGDVAWYKENAGGTTHDVGTKQANELGLYDMSGNVWEWCRDWYGSYPAGSVTDPAGPTTGSIRVFRGGRWADGAGYCRSAVRIWGGPGSRNNYLGLRLCLPVLKK